MYLFYQIYLLYIAENAGSLVTQFKAYCFKLVLRDQRWLNPLWGRNFRMRSAPTSVCKRGGEASSRLAGSGPQWNVAPGIIYLN